MPIKVKTIKGEIDKIRVSDYRERRAVDYRFGTMRGLPTKGFLYEFEHEEYSRGVLDDERIRREIETGQRD